MLKVGGRKAKQWTIEDTIGILELQVFSNQSLQSQSGPLVTYLLLNKTGQVLQLDIAFLKWVKFSVDLPEDLILVAHIDKSVKYAI